MNGPRTRESDLKALVDAGFVAPDVFDWPGDLADFVLSLESFQWWLSEPAESRISLKQWP